MSSVTSESPVQPAFPPADPLERFAWRLSGRYAIERELGRGGNGLVLLARDLRHERRVAIKLVHPELALTQAAERFRQEVEFAATLRHANVLPVLDSGIAGDTLYCVMPYVTGGSLRSRMDRDEQLPLRDALSIARQAARALACAHRAGIVHRDVKPENLLLEGHHVYVADFGVARALDEAAPERFTASDMTIGTPAYMSPEQTAPGTAVDGRTDIYSLGIVLYEMLTGRLPFPGGWVRSALFRHISPSAPSPVIRRPDLPRPIARLVLRMIAERPADRFPSADALGQALDAVMGGRASSRRLASWPRSIADAARAVGRVCGFA